MRTRDIRQWLRTADVASAESPYDSDDDMAPGQSVPTGPASPDEGGSDWNGFVTHVAAVLRHPSPKRRQHFLRECIPLVANDAETTSDERVELYQLLLQASLFHQDRASRLSLLEAAHLLLSADVGDKVQAPYDSVLVLSAHRALRSEVDRVCNANDGSARAPRAQVANVHMWIAVLLSHILRGDAAHLQGDVHLSTLLSAFALTHMCLLITKPTTHTDRLIGGVLHTAWRTFRQAPQQLDLCLRVALDMPANAVWRSVVLQGVILDVARHLKAKDRALGVSCMEQHRDVVLQYYMSHIVSAKTAVPRSVVHALDGFLRTHVTQAALDEHVFPTLQKMLLRSPELAFHVADGLCRAVPVDATAVLARFQTVLLSSIVSSNATTREGALAFATTLLTTSGVNVDSFVEAASKSIKPAESRTEDQRRSQCALLEAVPPSIAGSMSLLEAMAPLVQKEVQPTPLRYELDAMWPHVKALLASNTKVPASYTKALFTKAQSLKAPLCAATMSSLGVAMKSHVPASEADVAFWTEGLPALRAAVQAASSSALTSPEAALEGCVAVALLWGPLSLSGSTDVASQATKIAPVATLLTLGAKPSFLVNEKVARKMIEPGTLAWHAEALGAVLRRHGVQHIHDPTLQEAVEALLSVYLVHDSEAGVALLSEVAEADARLALRLVLHLLRRDVAWAPHTVHRMLTLLASKERAFLLPDLVVVAHSALLHDREGDAFVRLCRLAGADPHALVKAHADDLLHTVYEAQHDASWADAAQAALSTLLFIAPDVLFGRVCGDIVRDLSLHPLQALSEQDVAIWGAPADRPYIDVLAQSKAKTSVDKGRTTNMDKWDAEVRASIAAKKAASGPQTLSKQDQAAVDAQLATEREIRAHVDTTRARMSRALQRVASVTQARTDAVDAYVYPLTQAVRPCLSYERVHTLQIGAAAIDALVALSRSVEPRAEKVCAFVLSVMLREVDDDFVSLDYALESARDVELRSLYQLRLLVDGAPLSCGTCGFLVPWLTYLVEHNTLTGNEEHDDAVVERLHLVLEILQAHTWYGADPSFPRAPVLKALLTLARRVPMLSSDAVAALRAYGDAMAREVRGEGALVTLLLNAALSDERRERDGAMQCLAPLDLTELEFPAALFLAQQSEDDAPLAERLWEENGLDVPPTYASSLVPLLQHSHEYVRAQAAKALGVACAMHPSTFASLLDSLQSLYHAENYSLEPEYDQYGMVIESTLGRQDAWPVRLAVAQTFQAIAPHFDPAHVVPFFVFALQRGAGLSDRDERVRRAMLDAGLAVIDAHGASVLHELMSQLESSVGSDDDAVQEAAIVLLGRAARHLATDDEHVRRVVDRLRGALPTPSELVQDAVASCLPALVRTAAVARDVPSMADEMMHDLFRGPSYAARRGAAYGLAALVLGRGIGAMREWRILERLEDAVADTSTTTMRQGAMLAYEMLAHTLKVLLEPYVERMLPSLLTCFGDTHADVREATQDAARVLMRSLSGQCLKLILPELLAGLDEKQWRTKKGAVELLGAMAFCAPRQLSAALPTVIPRLSDVLTDSHRQVSAAANQSLKQFGEVIHNPEIHHLVPTLLKALVDPNAKTASALKALLHTKFVHYIDGPSLALIAPILERGLRERSVTAQKQAAQIVGNLASLTDSRDYVPYLARYTPLVRGVLVSPVPDARATAAHALGTLVERLGEVHFADLVPSLLQVLQTDATGVDRHGAAQGLAEVLAGLGMERMERLLPSIIENTQASASYVREGHLALLIYLPATFGSRFVLHLGRIVPPIVSSMADDVESVREASLRAGRMLIVNYTQRSVDLLLPQLEPRLFDERHRVRLSSLQLTADLLFRVGGIAGKAEVGDAEAGDGDLDVDMAEADDVTDQAPHSSIQRQLTQALGSERRQRLLAAIYILRQDPSIPVRQTAAQTWKALVHNTPRTAREVLPIMLDLLLGALAAEGDEQRDMAGRTLGELVRKLGEKILGETVPLLAERAQNAPRASTRAGVCRAVTDILSNATKTQLEDHEASLIAIVRGALGDESAMVRAAAAHALDAMQSHLGAHAIDATVPTLLGALEDDERATTALAALREVVRTQPEAVVPVVIPTLVRTPLSEAHAHALAELLPVMGATLAPHIASVLGALAATISPADLEADAHWPVADALFASVRDIDALHQAMIQLLGWLGHRTPERRTLGCLLFVRFTQHVAIGWDDYTIDYVRKLVALFDDPSPMVTPAALAALDACVKAVPKDHWDALVVPLRRALESTGAPGTPLPGLLLPRGAGPMVPVLLHGLLQGTAEQREQGALGLADLVLRTTADAIKPFITAMVGPLIRLCGDRHAPPVKAAILTSLDTMIHHVPALVRPFYPQLQRSFQKALGDPASANVRGKAASALGFLMGLQTRVEGVIQELVQQIQQALADPSSDETTDAAATALADIVRHVAADKLSEPVRESMAACLTSAFHANEEPREAMKRALAELCAAMLQAHPTSMAPVLDAEILQPAPVDVQLAALCLRACMEEAPEALYEATRPPTMLAQLTGAWLSEAPSVVRPARETRDAMRRTAPWKSDEAVQSALK